MGRIAEKDLYIPTLRIAASRPDSFITTTDLISELEKIFIVQGEDAEILGGRDDTKFSQKVRNLISHRDNGNNIIAKGFATYHQDKQGIEITDEGKKLLDQLE